MKFRSCYERFASAASALQSPLLLIIRLYWGYSFIMTGWAKVTHLSKIESYFESLHIPFPLLNAALAGGAELICGILLVIGLLSRLASLALVFVLAVAYVTAERGALQSIFTDPDKFTGATPFLFLFAVLIILAFGPGLFSLDRFIFGGPANKPSRR